MRNRLAIGAPMPASITPAARVIACPRSTTTPAGQSRKIAFRWVRSSLVHPWRRNTVGRICTSRISWLVATGLLLARSPCGRRAVVRVLCAGLQVVEDGIDVRLDAHEARRQLALPSSREERERALELGDASLKLRVHAMPVRVRHRRHLSAW